MPFIYNSLSFFKKKKLLSTLRLTNNAFEKACIVRKAWSEATRSEFSDRAVAAAEVIVASAEKDLIDVVASEDFEVVRGLDVGLSRFFSFSFTCKRTGVDENKRVRREAQLGNLGVR
jgi:hypothetical protein